MMIETERLILRPWEEQDAEDLYRYAADPRIGPAAGWPVHTSVENSRQVILTTLAAPETYAVCLKDQPRPVGSIALKFHSDLAKEDDEAELGFWIGAPFWGRGLIPEAARALLRHAFVDLHLKRVWCGYYEGNTRSRAVQNKLGFRFVSVSDNVPVPLLGEIRRGYANCMTREEWQERQDRNVNIEDKI